MEPGSPATTLSQLSDKLQEALACVVQALEAEEQAGSIRALQSYAKAQAAVERCVSVHLPNLQSELRRAPAPADGELLDDAALEVLEEVLAGLAQTYHERIQDLTRTAVTAPCMAITSPALLPSPRHDADTPGQASQPLLEPWGYSQHEGQTSSGFAVVGACNAALPIQMRQAGDPAAGPRQDPTFIDSTRDDAMVAALVQQCKRGLLGGLDDMAGLWDLKRQLRQALLMPLALPHLFTGLRTPSRTFLFYGPPGTGKTMLVEKAAAEAGLGLLALSPSTLLSRWSGDSEKLVRAAFRAAASMQPCAIFLDEVDSLVPQRGGRAAEVDPSSRRLLTELLLQLNWVLDGAGTTGRQDMEQQTGRPGPAPVGPICAQPIEGGGQASAATAAPSQVYVFAATNRLQDCDTALVRRFQRRFHVPLPDAMGREAFWAAALQRPEMAHDLGDVRRGASACPELAYLVRATDGYSFSDLAAAAREAALQPLDELLMNAPLAAPRDPSHPATQAPGLGAAAGTALQPRPLQMCDFEVALARVRPAAQDQVQAACLDACM